MKVTIDDASCIGYVKPSVSIDNLPTGNIIAMVHIEPLSMPESVYVDAYGDSDHERGEYRKVRKCRVKLMPMSGYHCSNCGELVTLYDANDMLKRISFCPCCGAEVTNPH